MMVRLRRRASALIAMALAISGLALVSDATAQAVTTIADVQGASHLSPLAGQSVTGVLGVVTARRTAGGRGFWIQDPAPDGDPATSEGVFVFLNAAPAAQIGDLVSVNGTVSEFRAAGDPDNLTITQINSSNANVSIVSSGNQVPAATVLGVGADAADRDDRRRRGPATSRPGAPSTRRATRSTSTRASRGCSCG